MSFIWDVPTRILFGVNKLDDLSKEELRGKKAMIVVSNGNSHIENGGFDKVVNALKERNVDYVVFDKIEANPTSKTIDDGILFARSNECDFLIGIGGGSVLDATTIMAAVIPNEYLSWDYVQEGSGGKKNLEKDSLPYIAIPTTSGTGSEVDCYGVISNTTTKEKIGFRGSFPYLSIVDPVLTITMPEELTAFTGFDALFHSLEGYIATNRGECGQMVQLAAIGNIAQYLKVAIENGDDIDARTKLSYASMMSGLSMSFGSVTSEHAIEHALSGMYPNLPHGAGLIMISEDYFRYFVENGAVPDRFLEMSLAMGQISIKEPFDFIKALKRVKDECKVSDLKMSDYGIKTEDFSEVVKKARLTNARLFANDPLELTDEAILDILESSYL